MITTSTLVLDKRTTNKEGRHPIKIRVTHDRKSRFYTTNIFLTEIEFDKARDPKSRGKLKDMRFRLNEAEKRAASIIEGMKRFGFEYFKRKFTSPGSYSRDTYKLFEEYITGLSEEERIGSAISYSNALKSFRSFKSILAIDDISPIFLRKYEKWMLEKGRSITTVGIYVRSLRAIYNTGIYQGLISKEDYPFGKRAYRIPKGRNIKKALSLEQMKLIFDYKPENLGQERAKDFFILSYLCNGANISDIAHLTFGDIDQDELQLHFIRTKTKNTTRENLKQVIVEVIPEIGQIIDKWGNSISIPSNYVFDILSPGMSATEKKHRIKDCTSNLNRRLKQIGKKLGFKSHFSMYTARHTYATVLKRSGAPMALISDALGHSSLKTTENYLANFEKETRKKYSKVLTDFSKIKNK